MDSVHDNTSVNGGNGVFVKAAMDHSVGARPGGGQLVTSTSGAMVVEQHH